MPRQSKGERKPVLLRLDPVTHEALQRYKVEYSLDGLPAVVEEWAALAKDRDEALEEALRQKRDAEEANAALRSLLNEANRRERHWKSRALRMSARREAKKSSGQVRIPDEWIERARVTPCIGGCGCFMDPGGLMRGLQRCPGCR